LESWEPSQHLLIDTGKPRKTCVEVAGRRTKLVFVWSWTDSSLLTPSLRKRGALPPLLHTSLRGGAYYTKG